MNTKQAEKMRKLGFSEAEIKDVLMADKRIDRGEKLYELDDDLKAGAKKARQADRKQSAPVKRERKIDNDKLFLIDAIVNNLQQNDCIDFNIVNPEREFCFNYNGKKYKIVMSLPRS